MDLLEYMNEMNREKESPLASRLRPTTLDEVVGRSISSGRINCYTAQLRRIN